MAECGGERRGGWHGALRFKCQLGKGALVVLDENGSVLKQRTIAAPLRASGQLPAVIRFRIIASATWSLRRYSRRSTSVQ